MIAASATLRGVNTDFPGGIYDIPLRTPDHF